MDPIQSKNYAWTGKFDPTACSVHVVSPYIVPQIAQLPEANQSKSNPNFSRDPNNFNHLDIIDMASFHQLKGMDALHQLDALADMHSRGSVLRNLRSKIGDKAFVQRYKQK